MFLLAMMPQFVVMATVTLSPMQVPKNYSVISWTSSSGNSAGFSSPTAVRPTYTPSLADIANMQVTLELTGSNLIGCDGYDFDQMIINYEPMPTADAGPAQVSVCGNEPYSFGAASFQNATSYQWTTSGTDL